ncbi:MAG: tRNA lysidine(34) synthetase TilS [Fusobacteriaceae bacterium]
MTNFKKNDTLVIRQRKAGDKIVPKVMKNQKKLKDIFIDEKIPKDIRDSIPILSFKEEIFWIAGIKFSEKHLKKQDENQWTEIVVRRINK